MHVRLWYANPSGSLIPSPDQLCVNMGPGDDDALCTCVSGSEKMCSESEHTFIYSSFIEYLMLNEQSSATQYLISVLYHQNFAAGFINNRAWTKQQETFS